MKMVEVSPDPEELTQIREKKLEELKRRMMVMETNDHPLEVTDDNFEDVVGKEGVVVVDCWAPWCGPCLMVGPVIEAAAKDYAGKVKFGKLNVDHNGATAQKFGIMSIPTLLFFKDGELVERVTGALPREHLDQYVEKLL
jgi:thioredoxin 1